MHSFDFVEPETLAEAIGHLDPDDTTIRPMGGATALMLMMKAGVFKPTKLVSLRKIEKKYSEISVSPGVLHFGALTSLAALERSGPVRKHAPLLSETLVTLANVRVRNMATVGGALAHGDPHMDLPPVLMALGATMKILGPDGLRSLAVEDLFAGYYETVLKCGELIAEVELPEQGAQRGAYLKVTTGSADDWPALGVAAVVTVDGGIVTSARLIVSAATNKATRLHDAEQNLIGTVADEATLEKVSEAAINACEFIADVRGSVPYKRELVRVYMKRAVRRVVHNSGLAS